MADHFSGPRVLTDPAADITDFYAFPSPEHPGRIVVALNVFPGAAPGAQFSDALVHRIRIRQVEALNARSVGGADLGPQEFQFDFTFGPTEADGSQSAVCTGPQGRTVRFRTNAPATEQDGIKVFAGARLDPFFIDLPAVLATEATQTLAFRPGATNVLDGMNVLSIVMEVDVESVLGPDAGPLLALVGETVIGGGRPFRLERMGRPEIKNFVLASKQFDTVNGDIEIRDLYNEEDAFDLRPDYLPAYQARFDANLAYYDRLDGAIAWAPDEEGRHPLTQLFLGDFLIVDLDKGYSEDGCFEIETALLAGQDHRTCGGRTPNDDIVDTILTLMVAGPEGERVTDYVDQATTPATDEFPYLQPANPTPPNPMQLLAALAPTSQES